MFTRSARLDVAPIAQHDPQYCLRGSHQGTSTHDPDAYLCASVHGNASCTSCLSILLPINLHVQNGTKTMVSQRVLLSDLVVCTRATLTLEPKAEGTRRGSDCPVRTASKGTAMPAGGERVEDAGGGCGKHSRDVLVAGGAEEVGAVGAPPPVKALRQVRRSQQVLREGARAAAAHTSDTSDCTLSLCPPI